jgi:hypothetical protein
MERSGVAGREAVSTRPTHSGLSLALEYAERGWPVFPCRPRGKEPLTGHGFKQATTDPGEIEALWATYPEANVAIATGEAGLLVLDVDPRHGGDESLRELERRYGELPVGPRVETGGGGEHLYFANPNGIGCSAGKLGPGLDVKAAGGYVLAPGSLHPSGRPYSWDVAPDEAAIGEPPQWLLERLRARATQAGGAGGEQIPEGRRDSTLLSLAGSMRRVGMTAREIEAALLVVNRERCTPPVDQGKVRELARRAGSYPTGRPRVATPEAAEAARELGDLLELPSVGLAVAGCRIVGTGREASADLILSDGRVLTFNPIRLAMAATSLMETVVSTVGAEPSLKNQDARHAVALMRSIGQIEETVDADATAEGWGRDFIAVSDVLDVDMDDQLARWAAFAHLRDAERNAQVEGSMPRLILRAVDGTLYVRTSWFRAHVRATEDHTVTPAALATAMQRVGWYRPGKKGRVKATRPDFGESDYQSFYLVPPGWPGFTDEAPNGPVTPGDPKKREGAVTP